MRGRVVKIWERNGARAPVLRAFSVGIEHPDTAINAVLAAHPEYEGYLVEADERLDNTAVAFLELQEGEVRDRLTLASYNFMNPVVPIADN